MPLPTVKIAGHDLARLVIGSNWFLGHSHMSRARDVWLRKLQTPERIAEIMAVCTAGGMNALVSGPDPLMYEGMQIHEEQTGRHVVWFSTPGGSTTDELKQGIETSAAWGAEFCLPHVSWTDPRVHPATRTITDYEPVAAFIRECGMIPGLSTHKPETIVVGDHAGYDIEVYIQPYNAIGFLCSVETDWVARIIRGTPKPVICIKPLAAGRLNPPTGLTFVYSTIKPQDVVCLGLLSPEEAEEDLQIVGQLLAGQDVEVELQATRSKAFLR